MPRLRTGTHSFPHLRATSVFVSGLGSAVADLLVTDEATAYVADGSDPAHSYIGQVYKVDLVLGNVTRAGPTLESANGLAIRSANELLVTDWLRGGLRLLNVDTGDVTTILQDEGHGTVREGAGQGGGKERARIRRWPSRGRGLRRPDAGGGRLPLRAARGAAGGRAGNVPRHGDGVAAVLERDGVGARHRLAHLRASDYPSNARPSLLCPLRRVDCMGIVDWWGC